MVPVLSAKAASLQARCPGRGLSPWEQHPRALCVVQDALYEALGV